MIKEIELKVFVDLLSQKNQQKDIKLKVEGKVLKNGQRTLKVKSLIVSEKLFNELGLEEETIVIGPTKIKDKKPTLRESIDKMSKLLTTVVTKVNSIDERVNSIDKRVNSIDKRVNSIDERLLNVESNQKIMMNTPTMKKELKIQKKVNSLKQRP